METADRRSYHVKLCNFVAYRDSEYLNIIEYPLQKKTYSQTLKTWWRDVEPLNLPLSTQTALKDWLSKDQREELTNKQSSTHLTLINPKSASIDDPN